MREYMRWDAVYGDGSRRLIRVSIPYEQPERPDCLFSATADAFAGSVTGPTPVVAAHRSVEALLLAGHDVRDLVPAGAASRAELLAKVESFRKKLHKAQSSAHQAEIRANQAEKLVRDRDTAMADDIKARDAVRLLLRWAQDGGE